MIYSEEEFLQLSGIQHFSFCRRQWALIHIENQWAENYRTIDGAILHQNAHDTQFQESRGDRLITRGVSIYSGELGVSGQCDVLEYHRGRMARHQAGVRRSPHGERGLKFIPATLLPPAPWSLPPRGATD